MWTNELTMTQNTEFSPANHKQSLDANSHVIGKVNRLIGGYSQHVDDSCRVCFHQTCGGKNKKAFDTFKIRVREQCRRSWLSMIIYHILLACETQIRSQLSQYRETVQRQYVRHWCFHWNNLNVLLNSFFKIRYCMTVHTCSTKI